MSTYRERRERRAAKREEWAEKRAVLRNAAMNPAARLREAAGAFKTSFMEGV